MFLYAYRIPSYLNFIGSAKLFLDLAAGLEDQGLYRLVGVASKVTKLLSTGLDPTKCSKLSLSDPAEWETKTITSAVKQYFRNLPEPLMTYQLHNEFINAASECPKYLRYCSESSVIITSRVV